MSQNGKKEGIHVVGIDVENLHRLRFADVKLLAGGGLVRVTGKNKSGKSSLLTTIKEAFGGAAEVTEIPIHKGSEAGQVRIALSNGFTITRRITEQNTKGYLTVLAPDGGKHGQAKLNEWLGATSFDPLAFFSLKPERQREILLGLGSDPDLAEKLDEVRSRHAKLYAERTPFISEQQRCRRVKRPEGERPEPVDVSAAMEELRALQAKERARGDLVRDIRQLGQSITTNGDAKRSKRNRIKELEEELAKARTELDVLEEQGAGLERERAGLIAALEATPPVDAELAAVQEQLDQADSVNASLEPWKEWERAQASLKEATKSVDGLTEQIGQAKAEEIRLIAAAGIPVPGLTFDPETAEPQLNGFPLALASGGERIRMAVAVALAVDPELRVCLVDEANDLDLEALEELDRLAKEHGFQVFACRIGLEGAGEIVVDDGEALTPEPAEATAS